MEKLCFDRCLSGVRLQTVSKDAGTYKFRIL